MRGGTFVILFCLGAAGACLRGPDTTPRRAEPATTIPPPASTTNAKRFADQPLITSVYTADPSAHVFAGQIYVYPSHDIDAGIPSDNQGSQFAMRDYHVLSMATVPGPVTDHGVALDLVGVPWAGRQLWAPDAAEKSGRYYLYFPAKDRQDVFRIGVASADRPEGPFTAEPEPIKGSFSIDPAVFRDGDGQHYLYFGGIWGGQLQRWKSGGYQASDDAQPAAGQPALTAKVARLSDDMKQFAEAPRDVVILDQDGKPLLSGDKSRRFFEASWMHAHGGNYYFSYSTGDTHLINYAVGKSPYGPFTFKGRVLGPVLGWTNHHSIVEFQGKSWLFYHDTQLSNGVTHLRNIKVTELRYESDGSIQPVDAFAKGGAASMP